MSLPDGSAGLDLRPTAQEATDLRLEGQPVQVDITVGTQPVGSFYGVVHATS